MLFHRMMRGARDEIGNVRRDIHQLENQMKSLLEQDSFDEKLFLETKRSIHKLHDIIRDKMDGTLAKIASQFTKEERQLLAQLPPPHKPLRGPENRLNNTSTNSNY